MCYQRGYALEYAMSIDTKKTDHSFDKNIIFNLKVNCK